ncbi:MAG: type II secretion system F family protein [Candidatus Woesearchaeota archaeon]
MKLNLFRKRKNENFTLSEIEKKLSSSKTRKEAHKKEEKSPARIPKNILKYYLRKAGFEIEAEEVRRRVIITSIITSLFLILIYSINLMRSGIPASIVFPLVLPMFVTAGIFAYLIIMFLIFIYLDIRIYRRRVEIEAVLADFLQLTSANMHAGMTLDKALWFAIRPRFGILSREIEEVAKETAAGTPLEVSLQRFASKYDSNVLQSSVSLIVEGLQAGGEMAPLLSRIASNIRDNQLMMREMAANVSTYVIFIGAATVFAAPLLMALSYQLVSVVSKLSASLDFSEISRASVSLPMAFSKISITPGQFRIFAILSLAVTSFFSAMIVSVIRTGDVRGGAKTVLIYIATSLLLFLFLSVVLSGLFSSIM